MTLAQPSLPPTPPKPYVHKDEHGVLRVEGTRIMIDVIVAAFNQGHTPEVIQQMFPALTLEQVYGVCTFYLANRSIVDAYLAQQDRAWETMRAKIDSAPSPVIKRIRKVKAAPGAA